MPAACYDLEPRPTNAVERQRQMWLDRLLIFTIILHSCHNYHLWTMLTYGRPDASIHTFAVSPCCSFTALCRFLLRFALLASEYAVESPPADINEDRTST
jgi:hypothetical protein